MKKLLVLALAAMMVLSFAVASMAAVTVGGEFYTKYDFGQLDSVNQANEDLTKVNGLDRIYGKIGVTVTPTDNMTGFMAIKSDGDFGRAANDKANAPFVFDEAWAQVKSGIGTYKVGFYGFGFGGKKDILDIYMRDLKAEDAVSADLAVADGVHAKVYYAIDGSKAGDIVQGDGAYALNLTYDADAFGVGLGYANYAANNAATAQPKFYGVASKLDPGMAINAYYNFGPATAFLVYDTIKVVAADKNAVNTIVGVSFAPSDSPVYARFEYDVNDQSDLLGDNAKFNGFGAYVGYKFANGLDLRYTRKQQAPVGIADFGGESSIKLDYKF